MNLSWMAKNWGKAAGHALKGGFGRTAQGALGGAIIGAGYGATSGNTSILGGAIKGAGLGAIGMRYGLSGLRRASLGRRGIGVSSSGYRGAMTGFGKGVWNKMRKDYRGARQLTNKLPNIIRGIHKYKR